MAEVRLVILPFLQAWDGSSLTVRLLLVPRGNPQDPLITTSPAPSPNPSFAASNFSFDIFITPADSLPAPGGTPLLNVPSPAVPTANPIFNACKAQLSIDPSLPPSKGRPAGVQVKKYLPKSYQSAVGYAPKPGGNVVTDCSYLCMLRSPPPSKFPKVLPTVDKIPWGKVIALLLRNHDLASAAGLIRSFPLPITDPSILKNGGFLYVLPNPTRSDGGSLVSTRGLKYYAARIPPLQIGDSPEPRPVFTPVQFPVSNTPPPPGVDYSTIFAEVENYSDGWAKAVHAYQPQQLSYLDETPNGTRPAKELGIRLGWDDEQVTDWLHRQLSDAPDVVGQDAPLGVGGYRVDGSIHGSNVWHSLCKARGPLPIEKTGPAILPDFEGELNVEVHPVQHDAQVTGEFWLPQYFCSWHGPSLVGLDRNLVSLGGGSTNLNPGGVVGVDPDISLTYGTTYDFRVRLVDNSFGGPAFTGNSVAPPIPGPSPVTTLTFKRWIRPMTPTWLNPPPISSPQNAPPPTLLQFKRPLLHYPAVACTGYYPNVITALHIDKALADTQQREPGLPDPHVDRLQINVMVQGLAQDPLTDTNSFSNVYVAYRAFPSNPADTLVVTISFTDINDVGTMQDLGGPLVLPTGRNVRLSCVAVCQESPSIFGADDVRFGPAKVINLRKQSSFETSLYVGGLPASKLSAVFCRPDPSNLAKPPLLGFSNQGDILNVSNPLVATLPDIGSRLAASFGMRNNQLTLRALPGRRVVIGCSAAIRHVLGPDGASITFSSQSDIALHWVVAVKLTLNRDWSWDALQYNGIVVSRDGSEVGRFSPSRNVSVDALTPSPGKAIDRSQTDLIFFDAIDPKPPPNNYPAVLSPIYTVSCAFQGTPAPTAEPPISLTLTLPITTPPAQIPSIVSAGIALSPFTPAADYSSTTTRTRRLWIEFESPPADPQDRFFARVLRNVPDPLLSSSSIELSETTEPQLAIDPEYTRLIVPGQSDDRAGLDAMQLLIPSTNSSVHFSLPLPAGMDASSPELFGFFTYEIRVGHYGIPTDPGASWSTSQGRYGRPLRCAGIQHPPPPLIPTVQRNGTSITVSAPFAVPVLNGVSTQLRPPRGQMWIMLYAQAAQLDNGLPVPVSSSATTATTPNPTVLRNQYRNILLQCVPAPFFSHDEKLPGPYSVAEADIPVKNVNVMLRALGLHEEAPLSILAVEMIPQTFHEVQHPLEENLGRARILRTSELVK
ncbi:hypothetical protein GP486_001836, partial [Trichoglossum hirsutum]